MLPNNTGATASRRSWRLRCIVTLQAGLLLASALTGCRAPASAVLPSEIPPERTRTFIPPATPAAATLPPTLQPTLESTAAAQVCSPLAAISLAELAAAISNPYNPPPPGDDRPHAGVDLADHAPGTQVALAGREVQAVLAGQVAMVLADRFPFGNALLIETALDEQAWNGSDPLPTPLPSPALIPALTCPAVPLPGGDTRRRSLYLLYAHLQAAPVLKIGEAVTCAEPLGAVGMSGNALNPHLHLEARIGPAGVRFASMAHYDNSATADELAAYCTWAASGWFQPINPLHLPGFPLSIP